jgi:hypothetical protein
MVKQNNCCLILSHAHAVISPCSYKTRKAQVQGGILIGRLEHIWMVCKELVPQKEAEYSAEKTSFAVPSLPSADNSERIVES